MKVLILTQYFWPETFRINDLAASLVEQGNEVTVLTGIPNYPTGTFFKGYSWFKNLRQDYHGARIVRVPLIPRMAGRGWQLALNYLSFAVSASILGPLLCRERYDLIFVFEPSPITIGLASSVLRWIKRAPVIFWVQDLWPESLVATGAVRAEWVLNLVRKMVRFIYRRCDIILGQSRSFLPEIAKLCAPTADIRYFPNSAEALYKPDTFAPETPEAKSMPQGFRVMFAGNIGAAQDFETILQAAEILRDRKDIHWVILGDGRLKKWVEDEVVRRDLKSTFHLMGRHPLESMPRWFGLSDVLLVTLKRDPIFSLTIPSKIQSYFACGKACIAALDGEGARIVEEAGAGVTCSAESPQLLAAAVLKVQAMTTEERKQMGQNGLKFFKENFDGATLLRTLQDWMREASNKSAVRQND